AVHVLTRIELPSARTPSTTTPFGRPSWVIRDSGSTISPVNPVSIQQSMKYGAPAVVGWRIGTGKMERSDSSTLPINLENPKMNGRRVADMYDVCLALGEDSPCVLRGLAECFSKEISARIRLNCHKGVQVRDFKFALQILVVILFGAVCQVAHFP